MGAPISVEPTTFMADLALRSRNSVGGVIPGCWICAVQMIPIGGISITINQFCRERVRKPVLLLPPAATQRFGSRLGNERNSLI